MSVMNGFRDELLDKILGLNGHSSSQPIDTPLTDYDEVADAHRRRSPACSSAMPLVEGQALGSSPSTAAASWCAASAPADLAKIGRIAEQHHARARSTDFDDGERRRHRPAPRRALWRCRPATRSR